MKGTLLSRVTGLAVCAALFSIHSNGQLVNCNTFLKGNYVEAGVNNNGAFGTSVAAPTGYHANVADTMYNPCTLSYSVPLGLGFVADPNKDGWSVGTPAMYGDYIAPRTPNEGWIISDATGTGKAYASYYKISGASGYSGSLNGANASYSTTGTLRQGVWGGALTTDTLTVQQTTTLDTNNLYLTLHIRFQNMGSRTIDSFFYLRSVNAHSDQTLSGRYYTKNKIEHQLPNPANLTLVSATGTSDTTAYMALGTKDMRARGFLIKRAVMPPSGTLASVYYGDTSYVYAEGDTMTADAAMGLVFRFGLMGPGDSITIDFGYSFKGGVLDTALDTVTLPLHSIANANKGANITAYPNPAGDVINITGLSQGDHVTVYDIVGRPMMQSQMTGTNGITPLTTGNLPAGIYILTVRDADGNMLKRLPIRKL
jgi:hypothetical protein